MSETKNASMDNMNYMEQCKEEALRLSLLLSHYVEVSDIPSVAINKSED